MNSLNKWYVENKHLCSLWNSSDDIEVCLASDVEQLQQDYEQEIERLQGNPSQLMQERVLNEKLWKRAESAEGKLKIAVDALKTYLLCEESPTSSTDNKWIVRIAQQALAEIESQNVPTSEQVSTDCIEGTKENPHECPPLADIVRRIKRLEDITKHLADK